MKNIKNYENYLIDEYGNIFSLKNNKFLKPNISKNGYSTVELFNKNGSKRLLIHRLVAETFLLNPNNYPQINHKDENPLNNCVDNLEWCTAKYNMNYGNGAKTRHLKINYSNPIFKLIAIKNGKKVSKKTYQFTKEGVFINMFESAKEASRQTKINHSHIIEVCNKQRKSAGGYIWSFERGDDLLAFQF